MIPFFREAKIGAYLIRQRLAGRDRYPLVLMLEPLFRCNLACAGCGKIDYPDPILNQRLSVQECLDAVDECGAPMVAIPGGEPLIHREIGAIVEGIVKRKKFVSLCTNALLLEKKLHLFKPSPYLFFSVHLDGLKERHDKSVSPAGRLRHRGLGDQEGEGRGVPGQRQHDASSTAIRRRTSPPSSILPRNSGSAFRYRRATPTNARRIRSISSLAARRRSCSETFSRWARASGGASCTPRLFLDFLAGNREFHCTPWGMPTRNVFGWQKPCYLLGEGYANSFKELMETTDWDSYGTGRYEKCANCMAHCGYEPTAAHVAMTRPWSAVWTAIRGVRTKGPMAPEIPLDGQRPAEYVFSLHVERMLAQIGHKRRSPAQDPRLPLRR